MSGETTERVEVRLRPADRATLGAEAEQRKQALGQFLTETLECAAAGLRQAPQVQLSREDVFTRRPEPEAPQDERPDRPATRQWRWRRLQSGPTSHNR